ncbi:condensin complex subunit 3-like [Mizuhopecten yessoensis]|uniref:Condensin complex subunit 3 n=1 Tax=Mizuhopecten yessoensis TaxID=6573 RepID=A0A210R2D6_MIZYE|nr:condensin complex subunit 3-like [Mizuhopecten yessoensis]OWF55102.1 Condensin complex subunit 3 [Mizuhopecten yessoensis]
MPSQKQMSMKEIFNQCQNSMQGHGQLIKSLQKVFKQTEFAAFWSEFNLLMKYSMIVFTREPAIERTIDFITKFITSIEPEEAPHASADSTLDNVAGNNLLMEVFTFLLQVHSAKDKAVRFRCCQIINKMLSNLGENAQIDDDLYDKIYESMLERLRDKMPVVRFHAVMALARLQDPHDDNCPVIKAYLFLINADTSPDVRRAVLSCIAPSTKTLPAILSRTRDVNDTVRKMAYMVMGEKVHIKALSIAHRIQLLQDGLTDTADSVKDACAAKLLQAWLRMLEGNALELLTSLDVETSSETCELALYALFKPSPLQDLVEKFDLLDENILIPFEKLTCESAMYWQTLCKHIHSKGTEGEEELDKVLPNCLKLCEYITSFVDSLKTVEDLEDQVEKEFILKQLLLLVELMELADNASRKAVEKLFHDMLMTDHIGHHLVKYVVPRLCGLHSSSDGAINYFAETISEIREPITVVEKGLDDDARRQNDIKIAGVRVKLNQAKEELEEHVRSQDFAKAAEFKALISELDAEKSLLLTAAESKQEEVRTEKTDVATILKCQTIVAEMLEKLTLKSISPSLQMLIESLLLPGIQSEDSRLRTVAQRALGLCCLINQDLVLQHLPLFMQASKIDEEEVRATALSVMFDVLHMHGMDVIQKSASDADNSSEAMDTSSGAPSSPGTTEEQTKDQDSQNHASNLVAFLSGFLDCDSSKLRTVAAEGLAKLLVSGRVVSPKILSHLILLWYNPLTEDDTHLRHCLGTFFPVYAFAGRSNQEKVEEAFMPTLKILLNAPMSSPLAEVSVENVAELFIQLTSTKLLLHNQNQTVDENPSHANVSLAICNEILSNPDSFSLKLWVKILNQLELGKEDIISNKETFVLLQRITEVIKDKQCLKSVERFQEYLRKLLPEEFLADIENQAQQTMETEEAEKTDVIADITAAASNQTVLNESILSMADTSSFFQEPKPIRRTTARSDASLSKTPTGPPSKKKTAKSTGRKSKAQQAILAAADDSDLENHVFASPTPTRASTRTATKGVSDAENKKVSSPAPVRTSTRSGKAKANGKDPMRKNLSEVITASVSSEDAGPGTRTRRRSQRTLRSVQSGDQDGE